MRGLFGAGPAGEDVPGWVKALAAMRDLPDPEPRGARRTHLAARARARRSWVRVLLEVRGVIGGLRAPHRDLRLEAADGTRLAASYLPGPAPDAPAVVLAHGFAARRRKPAYALLADVLAGFVHVLTLDLRGHGGSGGRCSLGDRERFDIAAAVEALRASGHSHVAGVGCSMGGTALLHAAAEGAAVDAVVAVSAPARMQRVETDAIAMLDRMWRTGWRRRRFEIGTGVRMVPSAVWKPFADPVDLVRRIVVPLLVVHGEDDHFFPFDRHAPLLAQAAAGPATLWREPAGFGHAEDGLTPAFAVALGRALQAVFVTGTFPAHHPRWRISG